MRRISDKQQQILDFIIQFSELHGFSPSVREIGNEVGLRSSSSVHAQLEKLREQGYLEPQDEGKKRALVVCHNKSTRGYVPILGQVTAGMPILAVEQIEGYLPFESSRHGDEHFALRIKGDSMIGAGILDRDYIVVRRQVCADSGQIVVALLEDEATCKTLQLDEDGVWLMPENPAYPPINGNDCTILGVVVAVHRTYDY